VRTAPEHISGFGGWRGVGIWTELSIGACVVLVVRSVLQQRHVDGCVSTEKLTFAVQYLLTA